MTRAKTSSHLGAKRVLRNVLVLLCMLTLLSEALVHRHGHFGLDSTFGFYAFMALISALFFILVARVLAIVLKVKDTFYDRDLS